MIGSNIVGADPKYREIALNFIDSNHFVNRARDVREGSPLLGQQLASLDEWKGNPNLYEVMLPARTLHLLALPFCRNPDLAGSLTLWRDPSLEAHGKAEQRIGGVIAEHLRRAFRFGQRFRQAADLTLGLQAALDCLAIACLLVEAGGRLVQANAAAVALLDRREALRLARGHVEADRANAARWRGLLSGLAPPQGPPVGAMVALDGEDGPLLLNAIPLRPPRAEQWGVPLPAPALGLVLIIEPCRAAAPPHRLLAQAFGLTRAEAELAAALLLDESLADYAERRGRSLATVRVQLRSIFAKTGTHRQSELLRRLAGIALIGWPDES